MSKKIGKVFLSLVMLMFVVFGVGKTVSAAGSPRYEEGGGSGGTIVVQKEDYSYPGPQWYAYLLVKAKVTNGYFSELVYTYVGSNLAGFSYNNPQVYTNGPYTTVSTHYVGWGDSWDDLCEDTLSVVY